MPVFVALYAAYSIAVVGYCLSNHLFKAHSLSLFEKYLIGYAVLSYTGLGFMVINRFPVYTFFIHGATLISTLFLTIESAAKPFNISQTYPVRSSCMLLGGAVIAAIAFYFRLPVSNFIFEIGDAGAYINSANHLARDGIKSTQFFPLAQIWFAIFNLLGGKSCTAWAAPFFSVHAVIAIYFLTLKAFKSSHTAFVAMAMLAANILAIWFARLPYSESLMTFLNVTLLYLIFSYAGAADKKTTHLLILIPLYVGLASLTRVTGIVWMAAISINLGFQLIFYRQHRRESFFIFILSFAAYALSVAYGLTMARNYYISWQLKAYLPFLNSPTTIVLFHICWLVAGILLYCVLGNKPLFRGQSVEDISDKQSMLNSFLCFIVLLLIGNMVFAKELKTLFPIAFVSDILNGGYPQDVYYLINFFGILALFGFPVGIYFAFRYYNPIKNPNLAIAWFFSLGFFTIYYSRVLHHHVHAVYLYYLRYFLSEMTILFLLILCAFYHHSARSNRFLKLTSVLFLVFYFAPTFYWISVNADGQYLENAFEILSEVESAIPPENTVVFIDTDYKGRWIYPGFDQCLLLPLKNSFGYTVSLDGKPANPYTNPYNRKQLQKAISNPEELRTAYVLSVSRDGERSSPDFATMPGALTHRVKSIKSYVKVKNHDPGKIFNKSYSRHDIAIDIWKVKRFYLIPYGNPHIRQSGFYHRSFWTDGSGKFEDFNYAVNKGDKYIILGTYGYNPLRNDRDKLKLEVKVNTYSLIFSHKKNNDFYFNLPENIKNLKNIQINSSVFVPKDFGINASKKKLGIDVKFITLG